MSAVVRLRRGIRPSVVVMCRKDSQFSAVVSQGVARLSVNRTAAHSSGVVCVGKWSSGKGRLPVCTGARLACLNGYSFTLRFRHRVQCVLSLMDVSMVRCRDTRLPMGARMVLLQRMLLPSDPVGTMCYP